MPRQADLMRDEGTRDAYFKMVDAYDAMAANEGKMANNTALVIMSKAAE
jgi:hypothetical protein